MGEVESTYRQMRLPGQQPLPAPLKEAEGWRSSGEWLGSGCACADD